jgi:hypothetical protein
MAKAEIPIHEDIFVSKKILQRLPSDFKITKMGYPRKGAVAQYRGPNAIHVHEYPNHWLFHRDHSDPRTLKGVLSHLLFDAPEIPLSIFAGSVSGIAVGKIVHETRKNKSKNAGAESKIAGAMASLVTGAITYSLARKE